MQNIPVNVSKLKFQIISKDSVNEIKEAVVVIGQNSFGSDTESFLKSIEDFKSKTSYELFTVKDEQVAGFAILSVVGVEAEILQIAVDMSLRKKGLGTFLLENVFNWCMENGVKNMYLEVRRSNRSAVELYEKTGFEVVGNRKNYYDDPIEDALIMTKRLCCEKK